MSSHIFKIMSHTCSESTAFHAPGRSSKPISARESLQPQAICWRNQKTSRWNCSPKEAFAKPAGKQSHCDKTWPVTRLYLLYKDGQQHTHRILSSLEKERKNSILDENFKSPTTESLADPACSPTVPILSAQLQAREEMPLPRCT